MMTKVDPKQPLNNTVETETVSLQSLAEEIKRLREENDNFKKILDKPTEEDKIKKSKEKYEWPILVRYRLWWGVPVLSVKTVKKHEEYDLVYKNPATGEYIDNHFIVATLADWSETKMISRNMFDWQKTMSEPVNVWALLKDGDKITIVDIAKNRIIQHTVSKWIVSRDWEELLIDPNCIN